MLNLFSCFFCLWSSQAWITLDRAQLNFGEPDSATENFLGAIAIKPDDSREGQDDRHSASQLVKRYHFNDVILKWGVPFNRAYGMTAFQYPGTDQRFNRVFNQAMPNHTPFIMKKILDIYEGLDGLEVLVDVGGGIGDTLNIITSKYPHIEGINYNMPHILADAPSYPGTIAFFCFNSTVQLQLPIRRYVVGVEHVGGNMFVSVRNRDAVLMKWTLHDWSDEHCLKLLKNCWEALPSNGKVIFVESLPPVAPENIASSHVVFEQDLCMLARNPGGMEFEALAKKSGFSGCEVICCAYNSWKQRKRPGEVTSPGDEINTNAHQIKKYACIHWLGVEKLNYKRKCSLLIIKHRLFEIRLRFVILQHH
ncbi:hypothetical protein NC652_014277 [Populus alba x Populus x berolinensis]|nr:hypothetical protein NC652_014277 [Populus alba x Populus x berolinensis]